jgi:NADH-quinone oxidoreductase subunit M
MTVLILILIPIVAGAVAWPLARWRADVARWLCLAALVVGLGLVAAMWATTNGVNWLTGELVNWEQQEQRSPATPVTGQRATERGNPQSAIRNPQSNDHMLPQTTTTRKHGTQSNANENPQFAIRNSQFRAAWIPQIGAEFSLSAGALSVVLIALTYFIGIVGVLASWTGIVKRVGFFHFNLMWLLASLVGVFVAVDLVLFYVFWELMLVPLYLLIGIWGYENRIYATIKFFIFTQAGSLFMLVAILALYFIHHNQTGVYTFDLEQLKSTHLASGTAWLLMMGFFVAFAVKLPAVPLHTWLPDAHTEAPTAGSIYLASLVLKAGAFGMIRFLLPLFPQACLDFAPVAMGLGVAGILYGAVTAFGQSDLKRLVAYTSVSHMGYVLVGVFSMNYLGLVGAVVVMLAHGLSTGGLFFLVGAIQDRLHTRDLSRLGGLWAIAPRMGGTMTFFALASLGLPGLANFVGEFLVLVGAFQVGAIYGVLAALGLVVSVIYSLWMLQKAFHGPMGEDWKMPDLGVREGVAAAMLIVATLWIGLYPKAVTNLPLLRDVGEAIKARYFASTPAMPHIEGKEGRP